MNPSEPLYGPQEVAAALNVQVNTVHQWRQRGRLPEAFAVVSGVPVWWAEAIEAWSAERGYPHARPAASNGSRVPKAMPAGQVAAVPNPERALCACGETHRRDWLGWGYPHIPRPE